jgi:replicative DNA helicase
MLEKFKKIDISIVFIEILLGDVVLLLDKWDEFSEELRVIVAKNRDGVTWEIKLKADFRNYKLSDYQEPHKFTS